MAWNDLIGFLRAIPDVVWSGIFAATLAFTGVMLSNRSNTSRLIRQLKHDAGEKAKDRNAVLRREVYLRAAEEFVRANSRLGALTQIDPVKQNLADGFQELFVVGAKVQMVSRASTSKLVGELLVAYGETLLDLARDLQPVHDVQIDIAIANQAHDEAAEETKRVLAALTSFNESASANEAVFKALSRSFDYNEGNRRTLSEQRLKLLDLRSDLVADFARKVMLAMKRVSSVQLPVMVAIRQELDLDGDISDFEAQAFENQKRMEVALDASLRWMEAERDRS
ncbi:hypothetical protein [Lysobacter enzymogenes]|uniref:hypothetical protein n=1 Tax=Lysobacter enzymogenes TaxID=69 RepID=UPI001A95C9EA|nr:hypothetical protein [Lysobacter enzymogenes]QQP95160.1 hypothetical protein JHW38_18220 [Lysobacter enzymogenes]